MFGSKEDKTMKTTFSTNGCLVMAAALAIAITSCTDDTIANDETKQTDTPANQHVYTMSVQANKGGADTQTRALSLSDKTLNATWSTTENIYMTDITPRYSTTGTQEPRSSEWATYPLKPQSNGASATLSGTIHGLSISKGDLLRLQFPKKGTMSYEGQKGTLDDIAANYDYAVAYVNVAGLEDVGANTRITPSGTANFVNQQAIVKFKFQDKDGKSLNVTDLTITTDKNMLVQQKTVCLRRIRMINGAPSKARRRMVNGQRGSIRLSIRWMVMLSQRATTMMTSRGAIPKAGWSRPQVI